MTSRTLHVNSAHKICSSGHLLEILPFICWGPTTNRRDNHKLEILFKFSTKYCFFDSEKGFKGTSIRSLHTSGSQSYRLHFFVFLQTRFVQFIKKRHNKSPTRYQERNYVSNFEQKLRSNFTHTHPKPHWHNHTPHTHTQTNVYEYARTNVYEYARQRAGGVSGSGLGS